MKGKKIKNEDSDDPRPLNFDEDEKHGASDHLKKPFITPSDERGDNKDDQYYEEQESISPEEVELREKEDEDVDQDSL